MSSEIWSIKVDMPPKGKLEKGEHTGELTDEAMQEELQYRQEFLDYVSPKLAALPGRPSRRAGNVSRVEIHGADKWSTLNRYLLRVMVDIGGPGFQREEVLPPEADVTVIGAYDLLDAWPEDETE